MKSLIKTIACVVIIASSTSCRKTYTCDATAQGKSYVFECKNCKEQDMTDYKAEIEGKGYTDVSCTK